MSLTRLYTLAGLAWGLFLGALAAWQVAGFAAGVAWLFLFGDDTWPDEAAWVLPLIGLGAGAAVLALCVAVGHRIGRRAEQAGPTPADRRTARALLAAAVVLIAAGAAGLGYSAHEDDRARADRAAQADAFERRFAERQRIETITVELSADGGALTLRVATRGAHAGPHRIAWAVRSRTYGATLAKGEETAALQAGANDVRIAVDPGEIMRGYHGVALDAGPVDVEVAETFSLDLALRPELSEAEIADLPTHEATNLARGLSDLIDRRSAELRAEFRIRGRDYEWVK
jgi:hypothetical protein